MDLQRILYEKLKIHEQLGVRPRSRELYVVSASGRLSVITFPDLRVSREFRIGQTASSLVFSPDGRRAYVSARLVDSVAVIDVAGRNLLEKWRVAAETHGVLTDAAGRLL